jgi:Ribosomal protein L4
MKAKLLNIEGKETKEIELPTCFSGKIREDITQKYFEVMKRIQPYAPYIMAGNMNSAAGIVRHGRRLWKTAYGHGISRVPRKIMWRRGDQFYWIGATISGTVGGRRAHPPRVAQFENIKKLNKKERRIALISAVSATASKNYVEGRYSSIENVNHISLPLVIENRVLDLKTKDFYLALEKILGNLYRLAIKEKVKRAGIGKARGRKTKGKAGILFIMGKNEKLNISGIDIRKVNEISISDLYPLGRLTIYTENAIKELGEIIK